MSMHKVPLTKLEHEGLLAHHLCVGKPSQLSDCFRLGVAWALANANETTLPKLNANPDKSDRDVHTEHCCIKHGCKYESADCTVTSGEKVQSYLCWECAYDLEETN